MSQRNLNQYVKRFEQLMPLFHRSLSEMDHCCVEKMELTPPQLIVLKTISSIDNCMMSDLSKHLGVTMGNMTTMVDRLIKEDYLKREQSPDDRRVVRVKLTSKGKEVTAKATKRKQAMLLNVLSKLSNKDIESMLGIIEKIVTKKGETDE